MRKFVITGIQMRNKGSQAMFLSLRSALRSIYPDCEVIGFANKSENPEQYAFTLLPYDSYTRLIFKYRLDSIPLLHRTATYLAGILKKTKKWSGAVDGMKRALREADAIFDASGYTLGSGWSKKGGELLLDTIRTARRYSKDIILMPQSFGPFDWGEDDDAAFLEQVKAELAYCRIIYAREQEGYQCLTDLGLTNVALSTDMVVREAFFPAPEDITAWSTPPKIEYPEKGSVGFILNTNLFRVGDPGKAFDLYAQILNRLVANGEKVYILNTSSDDVDLVGKVVSMIAAPERIEIISGEYSSPHLIDLISRFKYVVASRYHSVVFAYRSGVPAVILGWASKYKDLAEHFGQQDYVVDIKAADAERILDQIDKMGRDHEQESARIRDRLALMQASSVVREASEYLEPRSLIDFEPTQVRHRRATAWPIPVGDPSAL